MSDKELHQYWKTIFETIADGMLIVDTQGVIVSVNSALEYLIGYRKDELIGKSCEVLHCNVCPGERKGGKEKYCALFKEMNIRRSKCTLRKKNGDLIHIIKNASVLKDSTGNIIGGVETLTDISELIDKDKVISHLRRELDDKNSFHGIIGTSSVMRQVFDIITSAAQSDAPVIIYGESGTGKELVAGAIHKLGTRSKGAFIKVNCAALNESLLESELFGHVKGAFTGADRTRIGRFEAANGGDIFLDEIGDMPASVQVKLLRVLQEKEIERVGDHTPISADARIISATNKELEKLKNEGRFREDLYYRIGVIPIYLPPLRERKEDIPLLINSFIHRISLKTEKLVSGISIKAFDILNNYEWHGNIRELLNVIEYAFVICPGGEIMPEHLPPQLTKKMLNPPLNQKYIKKVYSNCSECCGNEQQQLSEAMTAARGNKSEAARILGISRVSLYKRLRKFNF